MTRERLGDEQELLAIDNGAGHADGQIAEQQAGEQAHAQSDTQCNSQCDDAGGDSGEHGGESRVEEAARRPVAWKHIAFGVGIGYAVLHLLIATALNPQRAVPANLCALSAALWHVSGHPTARMQASMLQRWLDSVFHKWLPYRLGGIELMQITLVATALLILGVTLAQHITRSIAVVGMFACMGRYFCGHLCTCAQGGGGGGGGD